MIHLLGGDFLAVHLEHAGAGLADAAEAIERQRFGTKTSRDIWPPRPASSPWSRGTVPIVGRGAVHRRHRSQFHWSALRAKNLDAGPNRFKN